MGAVLVVGASGVIGTAATEHFLRAGRDVVAISRRPPRLAPGTPTPHHIRVDLRERQKVLTALATAPEVSEVIYAALAEKPGLVQGWRDDEQMRTNLAMFRNVLDGLGAHASVRHVTVLQGTKAYGSHLHPIPVPAKEDAPRDPHPNFYFLQEDVLRDVAGRRGWPWTIFRPQIVIGSAVGVAMNLIPVLGVYAALCRRQGRPFAFPGGPTAPWEMADADLCAAAFDWAARTPSAHGEIFNLTNGDVFEWRSLWPAIADAVGLRPAADSPLALADWLPAQREDWEEIQREHGLVRLPLADLLGESHHYADHCFNYHGAIPTPRLVSTVKVRQAGFGLFYDTPAAVRARLHELMNRRLLPELGH